MLKNALCLFLLSCFLLGCSSLTVFQKEERPRPNGFKQILQAKTEQCRRKIATAEIPQTRSKIFWAAGLQSPTHAQLINQQSIREDEKPEIKQLELLIDYCHNNYQQTITAYFSVDYRMQFEKHLQWKQENLRNLGNGSISFGDYNRNEVELLNKLTMDLQFLDQKYRISTQLHAQPSSPSGMKSLRTFFFYQMLLDLLTVLPLLVL